MMCTAAGTFGTLKRSQQSQFRFRWGLRRWMWPIDDDVWRFLAFSKNLERLTGIVVNAGEGRRIGKGHFDVNQLRLKPILFRHWRNVKLRLKSLGRKIRAFGDFSDECNAWFTQSIYRPMPWVSRWHIYWRDSCRALNTPIKVPTIFPGYIRTELNEGAKKLPFEVDEKTGSKALVKAIERNPWRRMCRSGRGYQWELQMKISVKTGE